MAKSGGSTRTVSAKNASASRSITKKIVLANDKNSINIKSIKGKSPIKDINDDIVINGTVIMGSAKVEQLRGDISRENYMNNMQNVLTSLNPQFKKHIDNTPFKNEGGGVYTIDTKIGGGQIEVEESYFGEKTYNAHVWNATYNTWKDTKWGSLNAAKAHVKKKLKGF